LLVEVLIDFLPVETPTVLLRKDFHLSLMKEVDHRRVVINQFFSATLGSCVI